MISDLRCMVGWSITCELDEVTLLIVWLTAAPHRVVLWYHGDLFLFGIYGKAEGCRRKGSQHCLGLCLWQLSCPSRRGEYEQRRCTLLVHCSHKLIHISSNSGSNSAPFRRYRDGYAFKKGRLASFGVYGSFLSLWGDHPLTYL